MGLNKDLFRNVSFDIPIVRDLQEIGGMIKEVAVDLNALFRAVISHGTSIPKPKTILELAKCYENACDTLIMTTKRESGLNYISGRLNLNAMPGNRFTVSTELYFQTADGKWIVKKATSDDMPAVYLTTDAYAEIMKQGKVVFEVFDPEVA